MAIAVRDNTVYAVEVESTEGTYVPPQADTSYVQTLADGAELTPAKELLERNIFDGSIGNPTPRTGLRSVSGTLPVEMRASETEGAEPEYDELMRSALGSRRQVTTTTADDTDSGTPHTASRIYFLDADASKYNVGDIVTVQVSTDYHTSPVTAVSNTPGDVYIELLVAAAAPFNDGDVVAAVTTYVTADSGHPSLSISKYIEGSIQETGVGCKVNTFSLENFTTGQLANWSFGVEGLTYDRTVTAQPHTPNYDGALPPIILNACIYQNDAQIQVNEFSFSLENTLGFASSTCSPNGRISSRPTQRTISGSINPYKEDDNVDQFTKFNTDEEFSLFASAYVPTTTDGEYGQVVAIYMPSCIITELGESDQDGLLQDAITFSAGRGSDSSQEEIYVSFS